MPDLTESEAIKALFELTSDYLTFSHNPRSSTQDGNSPSSSLPQGSPLPLCKSLQHHSTCLASDPLRSTDPLLQHASLNLSQASPITYFYPNGFFDNVAQSSSAPPSDVSPPFPTHSPASKLWAQHVDPTLSSPAPCRSISCFDLVGTIGCGSYGKVLLGSISNESTGGSVLRAIKVMRKHVIHEDGVEEVRRELRALRWIADTARYVDATQQPQNSGVSFLQKMIESFQNEEFVFIVLEYHPVSLVYPLVAARLRLHPCSTSTSSDANNSISKSESLPVSFSSLSLDLQSASRSKDCIIPFERLRLVAAELVLGLIFLHQSGIVHQDIKPANIMISSDGHIVIADFGASNALPFSFNYDFPVMPGSRVQKTFHPIVLNAHDFITFTPLYAAPELVCRNRAGLIIYDSRVDWWSFGVVLYELATGSAPFTNSSATTTKDEVLPLGDGRHHKEAKRRNMGDFSLSFGAMENLLAALQCDKDDHIHELVLQLQTFIQALLVEHAHERLSGQDVKDHSFFESISNSWNEVAALEHPPLPGPLAVSLDPDISLGIALSPRICSSTYDDRSLVASLSQSTGNEGRSLHEFNQLNSPSSLNITWSVPSEGLLADDPIDRPLVATERSCNDKNTDVARNLRETVSASVNTLDEESFLFIHSDEEVNQGGEEEEVTEDGMSSQISPLQSFPSTASLHFVFPAPEQVNQDLRLDSVEHESQPVMNANSEAAMGVDDDVEIWNPWNPRPFDALLDPTDSFPSVLPNPYSPRPTLVHGPESAHEFQSLHGVASLDSQSKTDFHVTSAESAKPSVTGDPRREIGDESNPTGDTSTPGRNMDDQDTESPRLRNNQLLPMRLKSNTIDITSVSSLAVKEVREGEDILFFSANTQPRRKSISIPLDKKTRGKRSFSRFSLSVRLPNHKFTEHSIINTTINSPRSVVEGGNPFERPLIDTRSNIRKKRFSFPASFSGSESKGEKGQKEETKRQEQCSISATNNPRRRFSAPLSFPARGPPSSFDAAKINLRQKSHILSGMTSRSQNAPTNEKPASNPALSPAQLPRAIGGGGGGISVLPFPAHELDRMRIEYQNRRATDPIPMPCTPRIRSVNGYAHTATLGRSTGTRMMAQAQAMALQRGHHGEQGARRAPSVASRAKHGHTHSQSSHNSTGTGNLSPFLQNELTMAVLGAMESKGSESRDFTTMNTIRSGTCRSKARMGISASVRAQSLRQGQEAVSTEWRLEQDREPATSELAAIPATLPRKQRASWAGMVRTSSRNHDRQPLEQSTKAKPIQSTPRLASVRKGKLGEAGNLKELGSGICSAGEGKVGSAFEDPCHRLSISHNQPDSEHSHHGRQIPYKRAESSRMEKSRVDDATRQRSLGSRLWKKLKQIVFL